MNGWTREQVDRHKWMEWMDRWNRWADMNGWIGGTGGQMVLGGQM